MTKEAKLQKIIKEALKCNKKWHSFYPVGSSFCECGEIKNKDTLRLDKVS